MAKTSQPKKLRNLLKIESFTDDIKDEIDRLTEIAHPKRRLEAAQDLVAYLNLHFIDYPET